MRLLFLKLLVFSHSLLKALVSELGEFLNDLDLFCNVRSAVETVEVMLEFCEVVRACIFGILDLFVVNAPRLVCLREALNKTPMV